MPAGLDSADLVRVALERTGPRRRMGWARDPEDVRHGRAGGRKGRNRLADRSFLKRRAAEQPGGFGILTVLEHLLKDFARLSGSLGLEEGPGEKPAIMAHRPKIQA